MVKLLLTIAATAVLLLHQFTAVAEAARLAMQSTADIETLRRFGIQLLADAGLAPVVLTIITVIAVYKPWGLTPLAKGTPAAQPLGAQRWSLRVLVAAIIAFVVGFVTLHLTGRSLHHSHGH